MKYFKWRFFLNQIKVDFYRCMGSWKFIISLVSFILIMLLSAKADSAWNNSVMSIALAVINSFVFLIAYIFCVFAYGDCFCQDIEHKYIYQQLVYGTLSGYTISKILMIVFSAILITTLGITGFTFIARFFFPWYTIHDGIYEIALNHGGLRNLLAEQHFITYYVFFGIQYGIYLSCLALLSAYASLFVTNRLFVLTVPVLANYIITYICLYLHPEYNIMIIFNPMFNLWENDVLAFGIPIVVGGIFIVVIGRAIYVRLRRRIENE